MMLKRLLKLVRSDEMVMQALQQSSVSYDLSPNVSRVAANNDKPAGPKPRLWLENWSEQDEERLKRNDHHWEGYVS